jgi:hypothetical protein
MSSVQEGSPWSDLPTVVEADQLTEIVCPECHLISNRFLVQADDCPNCWRNL